MYLIPLFTQNICWVRDGCSVHDTAVIGAHDVPKEVTAFVKYLTLLKLENWVRWPRGA